MSNRKKIALVTGGLGFIGTRLIKQIAEKYDEIIVLDNLSQRVHGSTDINRFSNLPCKIVKGNVQDKTTWERVGTEFPHDQFELDVIHLASNTSTANSILNPVEHVETNVLGTAIMCEFLQNYLENLNLILVTSTRALYGEGVWSDSSGNLVQPEIRKKLNLEQGIWNPYFEGKECVIPRGSSFKTCTPNPSNIYGATKFAQENIVKIWAESYNLKYSILRLQNVYGPGQSLWNSYSGVVSMFIKQALLCETIEIYEEGGIIRDFIFVDDVVRIIDYALDNPETFKLIDVGIGKPTSLLDLANLISIKTPNSNFEVNKKFRVGDVRGIYSDNSDLVAKLPNFDFTEIEFGIDSLLNWAELEIQKS